MNYAQAQVEDRRLVLLKGLEVAAQYRANDHLLRRFADSVGHVVSRDRLLADLAWLAEAGLVSVDSQPEVSVATLNQRGLDVACGRAVVPGVQRPTPGL